MNAKTLTQTRKPIASHVYQDILLYDELCETYMENCNKQRLLWKNDAVVQHTRVSNVANIFEQFCSATCSLR